MLPQLLPPPAPTPYLPLCSLPSCIIAASAPAPTQPPLHPDQNGRPEHTYSRLDFSKVTERRRAQILIQCWKHRDSVDEEKPLKSDQECRRCPQCVHSTGTGQLGKENTWRQPTLLTHPAPPLLYVLPRPPPHPHWEDCEFLFLLHPATCLECMIYIHLEAFPPSAAFCAFQFDLPASLHSIFISSSSIGAFWLAVRRMSGMGLTTVVL